MKAKLATKAGKRDLYKLRLDSTMFDVSAPMNREQRRQAERHKRKFGVELGKPNAKGQRGAACGASAAPTGCASNGNHNERTEK